jgi:hypothetical protein
MSAKKGRPLSPHIQAALDRIAPTIERMIRARASRKELVNFMKDAGIPARTAHRILEHANTYLPRTDLVDVLRRRGRDPQRELTALKQTIVARAKDGMSRSELMKQLCAAGVSARTARRFLEPYYLHPDPLIRMSREIGRDIKQIESQNIQDRCDALWPKVLRRLKEGEPVKPILDDVMEALGDDGITHANVAGLVQPLLELAGRTA